MRAELRPDGNVVGVRHMLGHSFGDFPCERPRGEGLEVEKRRLPIGSLNQQQLFGTLSNTHRVKKVQQHKFQWKQ